MRETRINAGTGIPSMLLILVIMFLMTFSVLSLVQVNSDLKLTEKNVSAEENYYAAEAKKQELLCECDTAIIKARNSSDFAGQLKKELSQSKIKIEESGEIILCFCVPIEKDKEISVKIKPLKNGEKRYTIVSHNIVSLKEWDGDDKTLSLFKG